MMRTLKLAGYELRRFRTPLQKAGLIFLVSVPLLYGAIYLWSNWDPYGKLDRVPVAVVNEDRPLTVQGRTVAAGDAFVRELRKDPLLGWRFVDAATAQNGLDDGRYYAIITVPPDFSAKLASGAVGTPQRAAMQIKLDDGNNFLVGIMAETVQSELERQIAAAAVTSYFEAAGQQLGTLRTGLGKAASGADQLKQGLDTAVTGSAALAKGNEQLSQGVSTLVGVEAPLARRLAAALPGLAAAGVRVTDLGVELTGIAADGTATFAMLCDDVVAWLKTLPIRHDRAWAAVVRAFQHRSVDLAGALASLAAAHPELAASPGFAIAQAVASVRPDLPISGLARQLLATHPELAASPVYQLVLQLAERADRTAHAVAELGARLHCAACALAQDARVFQARVPALQGTLRKAAANLDKLDKGARSAASGARKLADGSVALDKGATSLAKGLSSATEQIPTLNDSAAKTLASPVSVTTTNRHPAGVYGRGLAPFFFAIALWVFGIVAFLLLRPVSGRLLAGRAGSGTVALAAWLPVLATGLCGAVLLYAVVAACLGLAPVSIAGTAGLMALGIASFSAIVHVVRLAFGAVGDALALVLLMVQLVSCGGLYPVETLPQPFRTIHEVIPMTYLVQALRVTISGGNSFFAWRGAFVLAGFLAVALGLLTLVVRGQRRWTMGRLKPELEL
jgi:putative membrane protein